MTALNIRPVTDLRNHYADVEGDIANGPVFLTKNGYGASVLISMDYFQRHFAAQDIYEHVTRAEREIDEGKGMNARESLKRTRARIHG